MSVNKVNSSDGSLSVIASRGQFIQYSVMPTPSVDIVNKIVQYIGTSTSNYTNGYFYKCTEVSTGVYNWVNIQVQTGGGGSAEIIKGYFNPADDLFYEESTYVIPIAGDVNSLYLSLDTNLLYRYNGTIFVEVSNYEIGDGLNLDDNTLSADTVIFTGTSTEWNAVIDKSKYDIVNLTDEATGEVVDAVENGNLNPVTSNAVYDGLSLKANTTAITNPNLLDNPWFTINQRGQTTYTANGYTVDRWKKQAGDGTITKSSNGITIEPTTSGSMLLFRQQLDTDTMIPYILGKQVTLSIMLSNGKVYSTTGILPDTLTSSFVYRCFVRPDGDSVNTFVIQLKSGDCSIQYYNEGSVIPSNIITVRAVKLELGSVSTLAMDTAPNTATELLKCQRYFQRIYNYNSDSPAEIGVSMARTTSVIPLMIPYIVPMIASPAASISTNAILYSRSDSASAIVASGMSASYGTTLGKVLNINGSNLTVGEIYRMLLAANSYIDLSADL